MTVFNICEYLFVRDDKVLGEEELRKLLSEFSYINIKCGDDYDYK